MNKPNILLIQHGKSLCGSHMARLRPVLELISYHVEICTGGNVRQLASSLAQNPPDLIIADQPPIVLSSPIPGQQQLRGNFFDCPQLFLSEELGLLRPDRQNSAEPDFPLDVIALHERIGRCIERYPRKHLRMPAHLPCFFSVRGFHSFGEILSLGTGGAFIKVVCHHLRPGDLVDVCIPLLGMKREVEILSRLAYIQTPRPENNYLQGIGLEFVSSDLETTRLLKDFLRLSLLDEICPVFSCFGLPGPQSVVGNGSPNLLSEQSLRTHLRS